MFNTIRLASGMLGWRDQPAGKQMPVSIISLCNIYPVVRYNDARSAIDWLVRAFGFRSHVEVPGGPDSITHAELSLGAGMIMLAGGRNPDAGNPWTTERGGVYVTVSDIDAHYVHAKANGAQIVRPLAETSYGAREYSARDIEGHLWSFGTYDPQGASHASSSSDSSESEMIA